MEKSGGKGRGEEDRVRRSSQRHAPVAKLRSRKITGRLTKREGERCVETKWWRENKRRRSLENRWPVTRSFVTRLLDAFFFVRFLHLHTSMPMWCGRRRGGEGFSSRDSDLASERKMGVKAVLPSQSRSGLEQALFQTALNLSGLASFDPASSVLYEDCFCK